mmetsp:Transcript_82745/g.145948  ORF Transcript_82745/g.145948 Transcript_82745/m.145948 type:complete len:98 (+) Transcript_82745:292-585(+)
MQFCVEAMKMPSKLRRPEGTGWWLAFIGPYHLFEQSPTQHGAPPSGSWLDSRPFSTIWSRLSAWFIGLNCIPGLTQRSMMMVTPVSHTCNKFYPKTI